MNDDVASVFFVLLDWLAENKQWVFSGIGLAISALFYKTIIFIAKNIRYMFGFQFDENGSVRGQKPDIYLEKKLKNYTPKKVLAERMRLIRNHENRLAHDPSYRGITQRALRKMPNRFSPVDENFNAIEDIKLLRNIERFEEVSRYYKNFAIYAKLFHFITIIILMLIILYYVI